MVISEVTFATGYWRSGATPQLDTAVSALMAQGWTPYGGPVLSSVAGSASQMMVKGTDLASAITAYTYRSGYTDGRTPALIAPGSDWIPLGDAVWCDKDYYLQAFTRGTQFLAPVNINTQTSGTLSVSRGGTGATTPAGARTALGFDAMGIGYRNDTISGMNWQNFEFINGATYQLNAANWVNPPTPLDTAFTSGSVAVMVLNMSGDIMATSGTPWMHFMAVNYSTSKTARRIFYGTARGPLNARSYTLQEIFNDGSVIPVANGGTGATSAAAARTNLGLGDSATRNVGAVAGTVAAGDDARIVYSADVRGSSYTGVIDFVSRTTSGDPGEAIILRAAHGVAGTGTFENTLAKMFATDGSFSRIQHYTTSTHNIRFVIAGVIGGTGVYTFSQTGNAVASGSWINSASDERVKENITPIANPRDIVMGVRSGTWTYKNLGSEGRFGMGIIANDIAAFFPNAVYNTGDRDLADGSVVHDVLSVEAGDSGFAVAVHHAALQSIIPELAQIQADLAAIKAQLP